MSIGTLARSSNRTRFALGAAVVVVIVLVVVLLTSGSSKPKPPPPAKLPGIAARFANPPAGISGLLPGGWSAVRSSGVVRLASHDGVAVVVIAAVQSHVPDYQLLATEVHSLRQTYKNPITKLVNGSTLSGLPVRARVLYTNNEHKVPIRILVIAAQGKHVDYLVEAFNSRKAPLRDLEGAQEVISSTRLTG